MSETLQDIAPVIQRVEIKAPREQVFALFTEPDALVTWWPEAAELEPRVGGKLRLVFGPGDVTGEITAFEPPARFGFTWIRSNAPEVTTHVDITITDAGNGGCAVELVHTGWEAVPAEERAEWRAMHDGGWAHFLLKLVDAAEGRPVEKV